MRENKLKQLIIGIVVGTFVLLIAIVLVWKFKFYDTVNVQIAQQQQAYDTAKAKGEGLPQALVAQKKAEQKQRFAQAQLDYLRLRFRSLSFDTTSPGATLATLARYQNEYFGTRGVGFGPALRRQLLRAALQSNVELTTKAAVSPPPQMPEDVKVPPSGFLKPITSDSLAISVSGPVDNIEKFLNLVNRSEILMVVGNIRLAKGGAGTPGGTAGSTSSDTLTATFTVTPYLLATGPSAVVAAPPGTGAAVAPAAGDPAAAGLAPGGLAAPPGGA